jgi:hypothetical protein
MKLDFQIMFDQEVRKVDLSTRNAQINHAANQLGPDHHAEKIRGVTVNVSVDQATTGKQKSLLTVRTDRFGFTFSPMSAMTAGTIWLREYGVTVTCQGCPAWVHGLSKLQRVEQEPEESWELAARCAQDVPCVTVLGLGLDNRQFLVATDLQTIQPARSIRYKLASVHIPLGRGKGPRTDVRRSLDQGALPILRGVKVDEDIIYETIMFTTLAQSDLSAENVPGVHFLVAEEGLGMTHTPEQAAQCEQARQALQARGEPPLMLCYRVQATNTSTSPAYAFFYQPFITAHGEKDVSLGIKLQDGLFVADGSARGAGRVNGEAWPEQQIVILLMPGETVSAEYRLLHEPWPGLKPDELWRCSFEELLARVRAYWNAGLDDAASVTLPEPHIEQMIRAGLPHLYLATYGERAGTLAPCVGVYSPIGSESSPIVQFYDSMGWHDVARRCLQYFLDKQHDDGRFQNFGGYMLETGAALWTMGEHYRYTRDDAWVSGIKTQIEKACGWIMRHRKEDAPRGAQIGQHGRGMIFGKVADPEDHFRQYMLNAYQYLGLARAAEMLRNTDPAQSEALAREADAYRRDIREALAESMVRAPVVPLGDGRWVPSCAPWVEAIGPDAFALEGQLSYTHEAVYARDSMLGPLYAVFAEIVQPDEQMADFLVESHYEHMCCEGVAFSQPYYSRHPLVHLRRGEVRAFLRSFYRTMAALADRETYTFWEHLFGASPHKTHEEGWFLMETRWMLYLEDGDTLRLLPGVPRAYLEHGKRIDVCGARSYFGEINLAVTSTVEDGVIETTVDCPQATARGMQTVVLRLPHPAGRKATRVEGPGAYDAATESVRFEWSGQPAHVRLLF